MIKTPGTVAQKQAKLAKLKEEQALMHKAQERARANRIAEAETTQTITQRGMTVAQAKSRVLGSAAPAVRRGENSLGSRPYSFCNAAGLATGAIEPEDARLEFDTSEMLRKSFKERVPNWHPATARDKILTNRPTVISPLDVNLLYNWKDEKSCIDRDQAYAMKGYLNVPVHYDPDEHAYLVTKGLAEPGSMRRMSDFSQSGFTSKVGGSTQSFLQENLGGALVPFPEFGPLVPLLRNKSAVLNSGAEIFPLPPSGRITFPRQSTPTTAYHVGEGVKITQSSVGTGQIELAAKKIGAFLVTNDELLRFGGPIVEQLFRNDMMISISLQFDQDLMIGAGSDNVTQGLVGYSGVQSYAATGSGSNTNGYTLAPQDLYLMEGQVQAANGVFEGWLIYPTLAATIRSKRASVLASGDGLGMFLWNWERRIEDGVKIDSLAGHKCVTSANVPNNRVLGTGTNLTTLFGGQWSDMRVGMYGSIEFAMANQGDTIFPQDQTMVRAILSCDGAPLHPGVFIYADDLLPTTVGL